MRTKAPHRKSRNGCLRCKARRVKCDQRAPACSRCVDRGLQCPGYSLNIRWDPRSQLQTPSSSTADRTRAGPTQTIDLFSDINSFQPSVDHQGDVLPAIDPWIPEPASISDWSLSLGELLPSTTAQVGFASLASIAPSYFPPVAMEEPTMFTNVSMPFPPNLTNPLLDFPRHQQMGLLPDDSGTNLSVETPNQAMNAWDKWRFNYPQSGSDTQHPDSQKFGAITAISHSPEITHLPTVLSDYFFKEVIKLYSVWDNQSNQLRILAGSFWQSSGVLYHTMQSMAAALLAKSFPNLRAIAIGERQMGLECLRSGNDTDEDRLIGSILLGHTASWIKPHELSHENFENSLEMLHAWASKTHDHSRLSFFGGAVDYWAMLLSFVSEPRKNHNFLRHSVVEAGPSRADGLINPHPFIGTSGSIVQVLTELGTLIFKYRKRVSEIDFISEKDLESFRKSIQEARQLERRLLAFRPLLPKSVQDPGDQTTSPAHFVKIDEGLRCTGLLQLYRVFPDLLNDRYQRWDSAALLQPRPALKTPSREERNTWLTMLALHILNINRGIPFESRTRCMQPFMFVAASCELRIDLDGGNEASGMDSNCISIQISQARDFVRSRMVAYLHVFPLQKVETIFQLIQSIWSEIDNGREVFWLDLCKKLKLGTLMG
ncbi:unnamed protein product [Clonostachys chloroleuca]|uniref:Zn(2)-C6 fungal-type domain-containing protein n=1 Tax=Clonostachys chloroleuca TaxID=1926264 RepID=A0AA35M9P2_9HYPO|nr:unnamed protein product [Clonostachys chloroleuca]